jgi:hypothetical protein
MARKSSQWIQMGVWLRIGQSCRIAGGEVSCWWMDTASRILRGGDNLGEGAKFGLSDHACGVNLLRDDARACD